MWLLLTAIFILFFIIIYIKKSRYWENKGVPGPKPLPFVGNIGNSIIGKRSAFEIFADIYKEYSEYPFVGVFRMGDPCLLLRDPDIIKNVMVKDFNHFINNDVFADKELDPILGRNPFFLKGEEWKNVRQFLTSNFVPSKVKSLFPLIDNVGKNFAKYLESQQGTTINVKEVCAKYTCDSVAICAFGIEGKCFEDPNSQFLQIFKKAFSSSIFQGIKLVMSLVMPNLIKIKFAPKEFDEALIEITRKTLKYRQEHNIKRNDYFDAVSHSPKDSFIDIVGHVAGFAIDAYETTSTAMTSMVYELAANPTCQKKLRAQINNVLEQHNGKFSYEAMQEMTYLEACINESLRMHPPLGTLNKTCNKTCTLSSTSGEFKNMSVTVEPGSMLLIPLLGLHMDPKYFPTPEKFLPERFLDKDSPQKNMHMPFGNGPRMCLGSRIGMLQAKIGIANLIQNFEITLDQKTELPLKYDPFYFLLYPKGGVWIKCQKINV